MTPFEHLSAKLKHGMEIAASAIRCDIEELASVLEELADYRDKNKMVVKVDVDKIEMDNLIKKIKTEAAFCIPDVVPDIRPKIRAVLDRASDITCHGERCPHRDACIHGLGNCQLFALFDIDRIISGEDEEDEV